MDIDQTPEQTIDINITVIDPKTEAQEKADVKRWSELVERTRKYDEPARVQYAKDRRYARGDSGFMVDANLAGTYIDILEAFLYARDPDFDVRPGPTAQSPSLDSLRDAVETLLDPQEVLALAEQMTLTAVQAGVPPDQAIMQAQTTARESLIKQQVEAMRKRYAAKKREAKAFSETAEIIGSRLWRDASLQRRGRPWVRSALTVGLGVLKASWQERAAPSAETAQALNDTVSSLKRAMALREELDEDERGDEDAKIAEYQRQIDDLKAQPEEVLERGFVVDVVQAQDFVVAPGFTIANHCDAPWNAQRVPMMSDEARAAFGLTKEQMQKATKYTARRPEMVKNESAVVDHNVSAADADAYVSAASETMHNPEDGGGSWVMVVEIWDHTTNSVLTYIEGIKTWVKPPWTPPATSRFYPFFTFCTSEVDGQRHPQSLTSRSAKLLDEYNRIGDAEKEHRSRCLPGVLFHAGMIGAEQMTKINKSKTGEWTAVATTQPAENFAGLFYQKPYAPIDPGLYSRERVINELERIWGVQEALSGAVQTNKTATEAEIQNSGFHARSGSRRDQMESALSALAQYTVEIARIYVEEDDARLMAGPDAYWPEYDPQEDALRMLTVDIKAGSSGKPDTSAERQAWATQLPILQTGIVQIGQLRQSSPADIADSLERLLEITADRAGDRIDIEALVPQAGDTPAGSPGPTPGASPQPPAAQPQPSQEQAA